MGSKLLDIRFLLGAFSALALSFLLLLNLRASWPPGADVIAAYFVTNKEGLLALIDEMESDDIGVMSRAEAEGFYRRIYFGREDPVSLEKYQSLFQAVGEPVDMIVMDERGSQILLWDFHIRGKRYEPRFFNGATEAYAPECHRSFRVFYVGDCYIRLDEEWNLYYHWDFL